MLVAAPVAAWGGGRSANAQLLEASTTPPDAPAFDATEFDQRAFERQDIIPFDIAALPLQQALLAYSRTSGVQVAYDTALGENVTSSPVRGAMPRARALDMLLSETDLAARYVNGGALTLVSLSARRDTAVLPLDTLRVDGAVTLGAPQDFASYANLVQRALVQALQRSRETSQGDYQVSVVVWLGNDGDVLNPAVRATSGDASLDARIARVLARVTLTNPPPDSLPQPLNFGFRVRAPL